MDVPVEERSKSVPMMANVNTGDPVRFGGHRHELHLAGGARVILVEDVLVEGRGEEALSSLDRTFALNVHAAVLGERGEKWSPASVSIKISRDQLRAFMALAETAITLHDALVSRIRA